MSIDLLKSRRESMRRHLLNALDKARPIGAIDVLLLDVVRCIYADATANEIHQQLDYLEGRHLVSLVMPAAKNSTHFCDKSFFDFLSLCAR